MTKIYIKYIILLCSIGVVFFACEKDDYIRDGGPSDAFVNMTTYDYLKTNSKFDSLVKMIDHAGLKDEINGNVTFFATTNYGVADYVAVKKQEKVIETGDENISFGITDIPAAELRDSLKIYLFDGKINREDMSTKGSLYDSKLGPINNIKFMIKLRRTRDYSAYLDYVDYVNFTKVIGSVDTDEQDPENIPEREKDISVDCQTSGIITTTGILHVLSGSHRLFFNAQSFSN
ncbi:hypothetical protein [Olivibacter jilunii]|uniref:hypothetical protein n=1 Tax=Olivibacter jilunii TaxID=985016 RepID=UPI003F17716A